MPGDTVLEVKGLRKSYGDLVAVNDLSLRVRQGEIFGLLGPNGAGKTTTINLISGFLKPDAGEIYFHGSLLTGGRGQIQKIIGICPQENVFWKRLTPAEQLIFLGNMYDLKPSWIRERAHELLDSLDLTGVADQQAGTLSGGMQRRLNIALGLIHDPEIIILDEPEAGLDAHSRISVREYIKNLAANKTVLLTTHNIDEADRMSDRVAIIDHGELLVLDTPEGLKQTVGEGDVLEIAINGDLARVKKALSFLKKRIEYLVIDSVLQIRALNLVSVLHDILASLDHHQVQRGEIRLRKNTLEDVFIQLTGRKLKE